MPRLETPLSSRTSRVSDFSDSEDDDTTTNEFFRRLEALESDQTETAQVLQQLINERFRKIRQDVDEMRKLFIETASQKQRRLKKKYKKLRQSLPAEDAAEEAAEKEAVEEAKFQLEREIGSVVAKNRASVPIPPPPVEEDSSTLPLLMEVDEPALPSPPPPSVPAAAPVAPMAPMAKGSASSTLVATPAPVVRKRQTAKCSRGKPRGTSLSGAEGSRVSATQSEGVKTPAGPSGLPASRTGVHMATRSKAPRLTTGVSRAEAAAARESKSKELEAENAKATPGPSGCTQVNNTPLSSNGEGESSAITKDTPTEVNPKRKSDNLEDMPSDPMLFSAETISTTFGGGKLTNPVWQLPKNAHGTIPPEKFYYLVFCDPDFSNEVPSAPMEPGTMLDLYEYETVGALSINMYKYPKFPVFAKRGPDQYMYCGIYKVEGWRMLQLEEWQNLGPTVHRRWAKLIASDPHGLTNGAKYLQEMRLPKKPSQEEILEFFQRRLVMDKKTKTNRYALRLSRTGLKPVEFKPEIYAALCAAQSARSTTGDPTLPGSASARKRPRLEQQSAVQDSLDFPLEGGSEKSPRPTRSQVIPQYDIAERSRNSVAGADLSSDVEDSVKRGGRRRASARRVIDDVGTEEESE
ncbi:hypothetical protein FN846DRAFT_970189 [Sphaerosporella brunnea]|uniref:DUF6697 domain-containing protein n=1 Tax=Sphaerosporella brunnea TaxID=1250544 RepID=A0A5J5EJC6_9PEZI|nr:hypothetical protein FN846DRAFT_970189 [Sphaerosporella brunnea]